MKRKFWRKFQVLNSDYKVYKATGIAKLYGYQGLCDPLKKEIVLDDSLKGLNFKRTLMHELIHAHQEESGLCEILDLQAREMAAESLAGFICAIIKMSFV